MKISQLKPGQSYISASGIIRIVHRHNDDGTVIVKRICDDKGWFVQVDGNLEVTKTE